METTPRLPPFADPWIDELAALSALVFPGPPIDLRWRLSHMPDASVFVARDGGPLVGFKAGYAIAEGKYYSWLGGVHPSSRGKGLATQLAHAQHRWLRERGYVTVETASRQDNPAMARLNLKLGFAVEGTKAEPQAVKVLWARRLA